MFVYDLLPGQTMCVFVCACMTFNLDADYQGGLCVCLCVFMCMTSDLDADYQDALCVFVCACMTSDLLPGYGLPGWAAQPRRRGWWWWTVSRAGCR